MQLCLTEKSRTLEQYVIGVNTDGAKMLQNKHN